MGVKMPYIQISRWISHCINLTFIISSSPSLADIILSVHLQAETATDLIAVDGHAASKPDEKIVVCKQKFTETNNTADDSCAIDENICKDTNRAIVKLYSDIRSILDSAISFLNSFKVC